MGRPRKVNDEEVLEAIQALMGTGVAPTVRELAAQLGFSPSAAHRYLERLREEGKVEWEPGKYRTLRVVA
jgi:DNA-binding IclR family transcriptional regulator